VQLLVLSKPLSIQCRSWQLHDGTQLRHVINDDPRLFAAVIEYTPERIMLARWRVRRPLSPYERPSDLEQVEVRTANGFQTEGQYLPSVNGTIHDSFGGVARTILATTGWSNQRRKPPPVSVCQGAAHTISAFELSFFSVEDDCFIPFGRRKEQWIPAITGDPLTMIWHVYGDDQADLYFRWHHGDEVHGQGRQMVTGGVTVIYDDHRNQTTTRFPWHLGEVTAFLHGKDRGEFDAELGRSVGELL
jgi:hypothetical protein